jgi:hypothetical protein
MRHTLLGLAAVVGLSAFAPAAQAQVATTSSGFSDPFFLYYGFFLPRQQALSQQRGPELQINAQAEARRDATIVDREGLYGPIPELGADDLDPLRPFGSRTGRGAAARIPITGVSNTNLQGNGHPGYFNRHGSYYPSLRVGRSSAAPVATGRGVGVGTRTGSNAGSNVANMARPNPYAGMGNRPR